MQSPNINLIREFAISDFKVRYQGSALGYLWALVKPLLIFSTLYVIFSIFLRFDVPHYPVYLFMGIIYWNFFAELTSSAMRNILQKAGLLKKINFPRAILVLSTSASALLTFFINLAVFFIFYWIAGLKLSQHAWLLPIFLAELYLVSLGVGLILASLVTKFRDLLHIWEILLQMGFWATPIIYSVEMVSAKYHFLIYLNPMTRIIQYSRSVMISHEYPNLDGFIASLVAALVIAAAGLIIFKRRAPFFAEEL